MRIAAVQVRSYKSFLDSRQIVLSDGFNVIVGQNNAGKTALIEALSLGFGNEPHRSLETTPERDRNLSERSTVSMSFELDRDEFLRLASEVSHEGTIFVPLRDDGELGPEAERFSAAISGDKTTIVGNFDAERISAAFLPHYGDFRSSRQHSIAFLIREGGRLEPDLNGIRAGIGHDGTIAMRLAGLLKSRVYLFKAERMNLGESEMGTDTRLKANASNLAQVLNLLQSNVRRFERFNGFVRSVFPQITQVTVPPISNSRTHIRIWNVDPITEREDLAFPLSNSGTGIGQVLSILYVVTNAEHPQTIIIDEPQSFLHPGAIRKLFDILKQHPQHQYIVTTHSPTVVSSAEPQTMHLLRKVGSESVIQGIDIGETEQLRLFLSEVGVRLADIFGADNILWVEGRTEELCFALILSKIVNRPLMGTAILGVRQVGDFQGKHAKTIFEIYTRLSQGRGLLPPAIGFIFDKEGRTEREQDDLIRQSDRAVRFIPRRMHENYLINANGIAVVMSSLPEFTDTPIHANAVAEWIGQNRWERKYFAAAVDEPNKTDDFFWLQMVHGADLLDDMFKHFSENRYVFNKVEHGTMLTKWIIENAPNELAELADLLINALDSQKTLAPDGHEPVVDV